MKRTVSYSRTTLSQVMQVNMANPAGNIHGGEIMKIMDMAAGAAAKRHARCSVVTARVTEMEFLVPVHVGDLVICTAELAFVGNTSMEVLVKVEVENLQVEAPPKVALTGYFTMVAIDENGRPKKVPGLIAETPEEQKRYEERERIYRERKKKLAEAKQQRT